MALRVGAALLLLLGTLVAPGAGLNGEPADPLVIAIIDTGIDGTHPEFGGYRGQPGVQDPQIVAWWDFALSGLPDPGQTWDPLRPVPFDDDGHGTGTASAAAGRTLGTCPGAKLAVAKVADADGDLSGDIAAAIAWAARTVGADVISMSFGSIAPYPARYHTKDERLAEAYALGALPVASAGNGLLNLGVKVPSEAGTPADSPYALVVGAGSRTGTTSGIAFGGAYSNMDPEVTAWGSDVPVARRGGGTTEATGTSFSAPRVAGYAACLMGAAEAAGRDAGPGRVESLLKLTARDNALLPYAVEGHGFVDDATYAAARAHAAAGTSPAGPSLANGAGESASQAAKVLWTEALEPQLLAVPLPKPEPGVVGPAAPFAAAQGELLRLAVPRGAEVRLRLAYAPDAPVLDEPLNDLDLYVFGPGADADGVLSFNELRDQGLEPAGYEEDLRFRVADGGDIVVLVHGYSVVRDQPYALHAWVAGAPAGLGAPTDLALLGYY